MDEVERYAAEKSLSFCYDITTGTKDEIIGLINDQLRYFRFKNQIKIVKKSEKAVKSNNLTIKKLPLKFIAPYLEGCGLEEDEELQDKWSNLLVNALDSKNKHILLPSYIEILKQISPKESVILDALYKQYVKINPEYPAKFSIIEIYQHNANAEERDRYIETCNRYNICGEEYILNVLKEFEIDNNELSIYIENFIRLRILKSFTAEMAADKINNMDRIDNINSRFGRSSISTRVNDRNIGFSNIGVEFLNLCYDNKFQEKK